MYPAFNHLLIVSLAGNPSRQSIIWWWLRLSKHPLKSPSKIHCLVLLADSLVNRLTMASWVLRFGLNPYDEGSNFASHWGSRAFFTMFWNTLSFTIGIHKGLIFPFFLGIYTLLAGLGLIYLMLYSFRRLYSFILSLEVSMIWPSIPAVFLPLLICVILLIDKSRLALLLIISLWSFLTFLFCPNCSARKIRWRSFFTYSLIFSQSIISQSWTRGETADILNFLIVFKLDSP